MVKAMSVVGVWLIGAKGNIGTTVITGAKAIEQGLSDTAGLITSREPFSRLELPDIDELVFGGHDIRDVDLVETTDSLVESGVIDREVLDRVSDHLEQVDQRIEIGTAVNCGSTIQSLQETNDDPDEDLFSHVRQIQSDFDAFVEDHDLDGLVVINVASSEPPIADPERYDSIDAFERGIEENHSSIPASSLYAYAAMRNGYPYVNFTPSTGSDLGGLKELAARKNVPHMGKDGKTGETLVKSALAPMFAGRDFQVLSWEGHNILGNLDGEVLDDADNKRGKIQSKGSVLNDILPNDPHNRVRIDYTPSLGDWKTAWDYIHFEGFMNTDMKMQFIWEGPDSILAAPLVIDIARLMHFADSNGQGGVQTQLASFFKSPMGVEDQNFHNQFNMMEEYAYSNLKEQANSDYV